MSAKPAEHTYCPTVLLVDDDLASLKYWRDKFQEETDVGVVVASSLGEGRELIVDQSIHYDAVIADLFFDKDKDDPDHDLYDGVDLLELAGRHRPRTLRYAVSFFADKEAHRGKASHLGLEVKRWIPKTWALDDEHRGPWATIERDLIRTRWESDEAIRAHVEAANLAVPKPLDLDALSECVRMLRLPMRTYLQDLGSEEFIVTRPIEVICVRERTDAEEATVDNLDEGASDVRIQASAPRLGLLTDGFGETVEEALQNLAELIIEQHRAFLQESPGSVVGFADLVMKRIAEHVQRRL